MKSLKLPKQRTIKLAPGYIRRLLAAIIDLIIINWIIINPLTRNALKNIPVTEFSETYEFILNNPYVSQSLYNIFILIVILSLGYFALFEWKLGQTPGKMLMKIYVILEKGKKPFTFWQAVIRNLHIIIYLFMPLVLIDMIYLFFNKDQQRFFEKLSKTKSIMVVKYG